ncbi:hypothetical protein BU23DRAFT_295683 [Bimuria novae-zelandiae CBS 107.79]|uniref:Uncharacterized protein n=1 Tax=Bimuria novae-zelandiae CBS 107.79 TaxID=1447943 RepID=A0A6A5VIF7_9PLEO|nr:hypothetical protein BU23DRAFT_295683 [Bimuria novae-zelandiae CBS 107.79]
MAVSNFKVPRCCLKGKAVFFCIQINTLRRTKPQSDLLPSERLSQAIDTFHEHYPARAAPTSRMSNTTDALTSPAPPTDDNTLSWGSVFTGGLLPIALGFTGYPGGKICDAPAAIGPWLRVSPIMCTLDMLVFLLRLQYYTLRTWSCRLGFRIVMTQLYGYDDAVTGAFEDFRKSPYTRLFGFLFVIPSFVKLYAVDGLVWTKVWLCMYIAPYVAFEAVCLESRGAARKVEYVLSRYFFALNVGATLLYYMYCYDPRGTGQPGWTKVLGRR